MRLLAVLAALCACGPDLDFKQARHLEEAKDPLRAVQAFESFLRKHPSDPRAPEAEYRLGTLYAKALGRCPEARHWLEEAARSDGDWRAPAVLGLMTCPDYFPLRDGARWVFVDTASGGKNMRLEAGLKYSSTTASGHVKGQFFAGTQAFRDYKRGYEVKDYSVWEEADGAKAPILRWPYAAGRSWKAQSAQGPVTYTIEAADAAVKVKAGAFRGCLKVRSQRDGFSSWVYDYYCPGVGRAKTTVGVPGKENPNTELASFSAGDK